MKRATARRRVPDPSCTVNGQGAGAEVIVAERLIIPAGGQVRSNADLTFACAPGATSAIGQDFVLAARVHTVSGFDFTPGNNEITATQTVK